MYGVVQFKHSNVQNSASANICKVQLLRSVMRGKTLAVKDHTPVLYSAANPKDHPRLRATDQFGGNGKIMQNLWKFQNFVPEFPDAVLNCTRVNC